MQTIELNRTSLSVSEPDAAPTSDAGAVHAKGQPQPDNGSPQSALRGVGRFAIWTVAILYLAGISFDGAGYYGPLAKLPEPARFYLSVSALFADASKAISEYRAEGWVCRESRWREIDTRAYCPLHADDK